MSPSPRDSESEPDDIYDDMEYTIDEDAGVIVLDENDVDPCKFSMFEWTAITDIRKLTFLLVTISGDNA